LIANDVSKPSSKGYSLAADYVETNLDTCTVKVLGGRNPYKF